MTQLPGPIYPSATNSGGSGLVGTQENAAGQSRTTLQVSGLNLLNDYAYRCVCNLSTATGGSVSFGVRVNGGASNIATVAMITSNNDSETIEFTVAIARVSGGGIYVAVMQNGTVAYTSTTTVNVTSIEIVASVTNGAGPYSFLRVYSA